MIEKGNPLQVLMLKQGYTELEIFEYFRDSHKRRMNLKPHLKDKKEEEKYGVFKRGNAFNKKQYLKYCKLIENLDVFVNNGEKKK